MASRILRPMEYGDLLDEAFDLYKKNFVLFVGIAALLHIPFNLLFGMINEPIAQAALMFILIMPITYVVMAAATWAVSQTYLGQTPTILSSYQAVLRRLLPFIGTMLITGLIVGAGFMLCIVPGIIFFFWYAFISEVFVIEGKHWGDARARSRLLAEGQWVRILVLFIITTLLVGIVQVILTLPVAGRSSVLDGVLSGIASALTAPFQVIVFVLLYYDIRVRKEGFDIEMLAANLQGAVPSPGVPAEQPSVNGSGLVTDTDGAAPGQPEENQNPYNY